MLLRDRPEQPASDAASELAALRQQVADLREAVRARDDFIAVAAHELRNSMTPIIGVADLALKAARDAGASCPSRVTSLLERMQLLAQNLLQRSTRLLDITRIEAGHLRLEPSATDLSALVRSVAQNYDAAAARTGSPVELDIEDGAAGWMDPLAAEQVIENLLSNALKFGMGKPVTLRLRLQGQSARLDVQDRGTGMPPDQQARLFGRFEQVVAQHRSSGSGIGLWFANRRATAMGGDIAVSRRVGEGSTFALILPLASPEPDGTTHDPG